MSRAVFALVLALLAIAVRLPVLGATVPEVNSTNPAQLIDAVAHAILGPINANPDQYRTGSADLDRLVSTELMSHFDVHFAARFALGPNWRAASPQQRLRFTDAFYQMLLHTCANDLLQFSLDRVEVLPNRGDPTADYTTVNTVMHRHNGESANIDFSMRRTKTGWKAYDVAIDGISYVKSFRDDFGEEIEEKGLDHLIARLEGEYGRRDTQ
jgi:phospholipid transport system substrate-binding protein